MKLHIDFETYSEADIKKVGAWAYSRHPSTEVICMGYGIGACPVKLLSNQKDIVAFLRDTIVGDYTFHAFNSFFEYAIALNVLGIKIPFDRMVDTSALAAEACLPRHLQGVTTALGFADDKAKDKEGKALINRLCKPYRGQRNQEPALMRKLYEYCKQDVVAEREVHQELQSLRLQKGIERDVWELDQKINARGVCIDIETVNNAISIADKEILKLNNEVKEITGGALENVSQRQKVIDYLASLGVRLENYQKTYLEGLLETQIPPVAKRLIEIRLSLGKTSVKKYDSLKQVTDTDGRARGLLRYHAASTGRWGGQLFQPQNLPRGSVKDTDTAIEVINNTPDALPVIYPDTMEVLSSCIRGMIMAPEGKKLIVADYSSIEARVLAWLAGQDDIVEVFEKGLDVYKHTATKIYHKTIEQISDDERFIGKVATLALGYQGGAKAFMGMAEAYGTEIDEAQADTIKNEWRANNQEIVRFWWNCEEAAINAVKTGRVYRVNSLISFKKEGKWLKCQLPSGRKLHYYDPQIKPGTFGKDAVFFLGNDSQTRQYTRQSTYGGKLVENITQAVARDLMAYAMVNLDRAGFDIVLTVHDEIIAEATPDRTVDEFIKVMTTKPHWAKGIPLEADGFEAKRYRK